MHSPWVKNREMGILMYANDLALCSHSPIGLQRALNKLKQYCEKWDLKVNTSKTKVMIFIKRGKVSTKWGWFYGNDRLEIVNSFDYLGITFQQNLM